jgi:peptidyl-prolyl cis-trans isomerase SurA
MKQYLLFLLAAGVLLTTSAVAQAPKTLDRVVAVIGDEIITQSELEMQLLQAGAKVDVTDEAVVRRVLDAMMNDKLVLAQAVLDSVEIPAEEITRRLDEQISRLTRYYGSEQKLEQVAGMNINQMKREFREDIRKRLMVEMVQQQKFGSTSVSHREVVEFFTAYKDSLPPVPEQVELQQIAIFPRVTASFKEAAREKAVRILDSIRNGASFEELAKRHSDDVGSGSNGGNLGLARRGVFVKEFEEAAFALKPDEVSDVVETKFGFHIIKLLEKKGEAVRPQHILIKVEKTGESDQTAIDLLNTLRGRILEGESFEDLAREYSEDDATKKFGGSLGVIEVPELTDEMKTVQQELSVGDISEPLKLTMDRDYAYAIVKLVKRIAQHPASLEDDYQRIANFAKIFKQNREYETWIDEIKKNVFWKVNF